MAVAPLRVLLFVCLGAGLGAETLAILGDSLTAGHGVGAEEAYPAVLEGLLDEAVDDGAGSWRVLNAGLSGDTSRGALARVPWLIAQRPEVVLVAVGANDGLRGIPVARLQTNLAAIIEALQDADIRVLLAGMQLPTDFGPDYRRAFAAVYPALAERYAVPLLPFLLEGVAAEADLNQADRIHPNPAGHRRIAAHVRDFLVPHLVPAPEIADE